MWCLSLVLLWEKSTMSMVVSSYGDVSRFFELAFIIG